MKTININYSNLLGIFLIVTLVLVPNSCSKEAIKDNLETNISSQLIKISGEDTNASTKTSLNGLVTSWKAGDQVGVYCAQATDGGVNTPYTTSNATIRSSFTGSMKWGDQVTTHNFYAYYPYSAISAAPTEVPISLANAQTQTAANNSDHIGDLGFMVATPVSKTPTDATGTSTSVYLRYNHVFTIIEFQIKGTGSLKAVKFVGTNNPVAFSGGTIDITQTKPESGVAYTIAGQIGATNQSVVTLTSAATLTATNTDTKVFMVINPGTQTGTCLIGFSSDGITWTYISKAAPVGGFLRGSKYVVTIDKDDAVSLLDQDNIVFNIVTIGMQTWMAENLKTTKYRDGSLIGTTTPYNLNISSETAPKYQWAYDGIEGNVATYGRLYTWHAAADSRSICPTGWHVPTDAEWTTLTTFLGGETVAGGKLKETDTSHWISPNTGATNSFGFTALPGGYRYDDGMFSSKGYYSSWLSSNNVGSVSTWYRQIRNIYSEVSRSYSSMKYGYSVRCLRDN